VKCYPLLFACEPACSLAGGASGERRKRYIVLVPNPTAGSDRSTATLAEA
jgi:hypothetical protein